jgi:hypothetical protein
MVAGPKGRGRGRDQGSDREYYCGSYLAAVSTKSLRECPCNRNGVWLSAIEPYITRYLQEAGHRLEILTSKSQGGVATKLRDEEVAHWRGYQEGIQRLCDYLQEYHPGQYRELIDRDYERGIEDQELIDAARSAPTPAMGKFAAAMRGRIDWKKIKQLHQLPKCHHTDFVADLLQVYRDSFDPASVAEEIVTLEAEEKQLVEQWKDLPTQRSKSIATIRLQELQGLIDSLNAQQQDGTAIVESHYREMTTLHLAISKVLGASQKEQSGRIRAELLRGVISRIVLTFQDTGVRSGGFNRKRSKLVDITFIPVVGADVSYPVHKGKGSIISQGEGHPSS